MSTLRLHHEKHVFNISVCEVSVNITCTWWPKNWHNFLYALTSSNINQFSKLFHCQNQAKICNNTVTKDPTTPQVCRYTTSVCRSVSLIAPLVSGVAGLNASSSSKADTMNIWCKNCRMWQLLYTITAVNFLKCVVTEVVLFSTVDFKILDILQGSVATHYRCGGIFSDSACIITNFLLILTVKWFWKSANLW